MKKALIIAAVLVGAAVLIWFLRKKIAKNKAAAAPAPPVTTPATSGASVPYKTENAAVGVLDPMVMAILQQLNTSLAAAGKPQLTVGINAKKILKKGSSGPEVVFLQRALNHFFGENLDPDGNFGGATESALLRNTNLKQISLSKGAQLLKLQGKI